MGEKIRDIAIKLEAIIDTAIDGIITIDDKGLIETINRAAANLFGYHQDEVIGNNVKMLMPSPYRSEHDMYINTYLKTKKPKIIGIGREVEGLTKSGKRFPFRLAVSEVILNDRIMFAGIVHDLTNIKHAEEELRLSNVRLEEKVEQRTNDIEKVVNKLLLANKKLESSQNELQKALEKEKELSELKSRFVSMASHEFRTPLSTVMSSASLISKYTKEDENNNRLKHVDRIKSAVDNLTGILNDFLSLSKLEENKVTVDKVQIDFEKLFLTVADEVKGILKEDQKIEHHFNADEVLIQTDERILKNILFNLLSNAIKYSPKDSTISCKAIFEHKALKIEIIDEGIGIPENEQKHLFDRFFRASNVENIQGTGLGLNIVKRYVNLLNGDITFESKEGKGTIFHVTVPIT